MKIKEYPEFSDKYPAIDGIAKGERPPKEEREKRMEQGESVSYLRAEKPIRSDVEEILKMDGIKFDSWYRQKESALLELLNPLRIAVTVPHLRYASEEQKNTLNAQSYISGLHEILEEGLEYLQVIKKVRDEAK